MVAISVAEKTAPTRAWQDVARAVKRELGVYRAVAKHPRTPRSARLLLGAALAYLMMPFDIIPDFIPIIGHLDDAIIVPGLIVLALRRIPPEIVEECRQLSSGDGS